MDETRTKCFVISALKGVVSGHSGIGRTEFGEKRGGTKNVVFSTVSQDNALPKTASIFAFLAANPFLACQFSFLASFLAKKQEVFL